MVAPDQSGLSRAMLPVALIVFFVSGFAALLYQVIWQRLLGIFSGTDVYSATIIVAAFMAGLGIGHLAEGHVADRVSRRASLVLFGAAEIGSNEPFDIHAQEITTRLADPRVRDHYACAGIDIAVLLAPCFMAASAPIGPEFNRAALVDVNTDLFPKDEYDLTSP